MTIVQLNLYKQHLLIIIKIIIKCRKTCTNMFFFFTKQRPKSVLIGFFQWMNGDNCDFENRVPGKSLAQKHKPNFVLLRCRLELFIIFFM